jgi:parallel beta-helix repeat protein
MTDYGFEPSVIGIHLDASSHNNITGNNASHLTGWGIFLESSSNSNNIIGNYVYSIYSRYGTGKGISLRSSSNGNNIIGNDVHSIDSRMDPGLCISLDSSSNNNITGNNVSDCDRIIYLDSSSNNNITGNNLSSCSECIYLDSSSNNNITGNNLSSCSECIYLDSSSNNNITGNNLSDNWPGDGIYLYKSSNNSMKGNNFINTGIFMKGDQLSHFNSHDIPTDNIVNGKPLYYYKDCSGIDIDGILIGQLILANCADVNVRNLQIDNTSVGIEAAYSTNISVTASNVSSNEYGIYLYSSSKSKIYHNNFIENDDNAVDFTNTNSWNDTYSQFPLRGGNYWSDWSPTCIDDMYGPNQDISGADGICDERSSYPTDYYPLKNPWPSPPVDGAKPNISNVWTEPWNQKQGGSVNITAEVTDNSGAVVVKVRIISPERTEIGNFTMKKGDGDKYYYIFNIDPNADTGTYKFVIWAEDASGNIEKSAEDSFAVERAELDVLWLILLSNMALVAFFLVVIFLILKKKKKPEEAPTETPEVEEPAATPESPPDSQ